MDISHIGGLYVINHKNDKIYHCKDIYNEEIKSSICKNREIHLGNFFNNLDNIFSNNNYLTNQQRPIERCQKNKELKFYNDYY